MNSSPYQAHSATSQKAAEELTSAASLRGLIYKLIKTQNEDGCTCDELSLATSVINGTVSARLIELERDEKLIVKTTMVRKTRHNRDASVYVAKKFEDLVEVIPCKTASATVLNKELLNIVEQVDALFKKNGTETAFAALVSNTLKNVKGEIL